MARPRNAAGLVAAALADTPVVFLAGPRQAGKSTLAQRLAAGPWGARYLTLDDATLLAAARRDATGFLAGLETPVVLDEIQRAPELLVPLKAEVDRRRRPGRFLLTGSANILALPAVSAALTGRIEVVTLWPFSQGELAGRREGFVDAAFGPEAPGVKPAGLSRAALCERIARGGFPEAVSRSDPERRRAWFRSYVSSLLTRDVRDLASIEGLGELPHLLSLLAARSGNLVSYADLSRSAAIPQSTLKRYMTLLEGVYLVERLRPWSANVTTRLVKAPKVHLCDTGVAAHLLGHDGESLAARPEAIGPLLESFVVSELWKQASWSALAPALFHFRTHGGGEVDVVLEDRRGRCVAVEVRAAASLGRRDVAGIEAFASLAGPRFHRGLVLYGGREVVPFAANIHAVPIEALWTCGATNAVW